MSAEVTSSSIDQASEKLYRILSSEHEKLTAFVKTLKEQQGFIIDRKTDQLTQILPKIEADLNFIGVLQRQREQVLQNELSSIPSEKQPGIAARVKNLPDTIKNRCYDLSAKVESELRVVHEIGWQNQLLLSRSVQFLQTVLSPLIGRKKAEPALTIYGQRGRLQSDQFRQAIFQGVG